VRADYVAFAVSDEFIVPSGPEANPDDSGRRTLSAWSPMGGVVARLGALTSAYANIATSFETPTATELGNRPEGAGGINRELDPQRATTIEVGIKGIVLSRLRYDAAVFTTAVRDELIPYEVPNGGGRRYFRNAGRTTRRGFETGATAETGPVAFATAYSYSDFRFDEYEIVSGGDTTGLEGKRIPGIPLHQLQTSVTWRAGHAFLTGEAVVSSRVLVDDANTAAASGWTVVNVRAGARIPVRTHVMTPTVAVYNAFDRRYIGSVVVNAAAGRFYEPAPTRSLAVGLTLEGR
jgi:iron complex outermembrane receptor protein